MIVSGVFYRRPKLHVLILHMGGELASILRRLDFTWHLNYNGVRNPPAGRPLTNQRPPSASSRQTIWSTAWGFSPIGLRAAIAMCGVRMTEPDAAQARVLLVAVRGRAEIDLVSVGFIRPH